MAVLNANRKHIRSNLPMHFVSNSTDKIWYTFWPNRPCSHEANNNRNFRKMVRTCLKHFELHSLICIGEFDLSQSIHFLSCVLVMKSYWHEGKQLISHIQWTLSVIYIMQMQVTLHCIFLEQWVLKLASSLISNNFSKSFLRGS